MGAFDRLKELALRSVTPRTSDGVAKEESNARVADARLRLTHQMVALRIQKTPVDSTTTVLMRRSRNHAANALRSAVKKPNDRTGCSARSFGTAAKCVSPPMSIRRRVRHRRRAGFRKPLRSFGHVFDSRRPPGASPSTLASVCRPHAHGPSKRRKRGQPVRILSNGLEAPRNASPAAEPSS